MRSVLALRNPSQAPSVTDAPFAHLTSRYGPVPTEDVAMPWSPTFSAHVGDMMPATLSASLDRFTNSDGLGALPAPVRVIWGEDDRVLPVRQSEGLAGAIAVHRFAGVGHRPHLEVPSAVARDVAEQIAAA